MRAALLLALVTASCAPVPPGPASSPSQPPSPSPSELPSPNATLAPISSFPDYGLAPGYDHLKMLDARDFAVQLVPGAPRPGEPVSLTVSNLEPGVLAEVWQCIPYFDGKPPVILPARPSDTPLGTVRADAKGKAELQFTVRDTVSLGGGSGAHIWLILPERKAMIPAVKAWHFAFPRSLHGTVPLADGEVHLEVGDPPVYTATTRITAGVYDFKDVPLPDRVLLTVPGTRLYLAAQEHQFLEDWCQPGPFPPVESQTFRDATSRPFQLDIPNASL